jgi:hypothetical protein
MFSSLLEPARAMSEHDKADSPLTESLCGDDVRASWGSSRRTGGMDRQELAALPETEILEEIEVVADDPDPKPAAA